MKKSKLIGLVCICFCIGVMSFGGMQIQGPLVPIHVTVKDIDGALLPNASVGALRTDGTAIKAIPLDNGTHYIEGVGTKVALEVTHTDYGTAITEFLIPEGWREAYVWVQWTDEGLSTGIAAATTSAVNPLPFGGSRSAFLGGGDTCATATVIPSIPYSDAGSTVGMTNDYDEVCPYTGSTAPVVVYEYTPAANETIDISLCAMSDYDTKLYVYENTCPGTLIACNDDACSSPLSDYVSALYNVPLTAGNTYYIVIDGYGTAAGNYTLDITPPCDVTCPAGSTDEGEPDCGLPVDTVNGGCNSTPNVFGALACDETICGTAAFDGSTRDTDWYEVTVASATVFNFTVEAEFDVLFGKIGQIVDGLPGCDNTTGSVDPYGLQGPCSPLTITTPPLPAGTYYFFVAPQFTNTFACGAEYYATLTCTPVSDIGACCFPDGSCQDLSEADCIAAGGVFEGIGTDCATTYCPVVPDNDDCEQAIGPLAVPSLTLGSTLASTDDPNAIFCDTGVYAPGVWYTTIGTGNTMTASLCTGYTTYDTKIIVYCGTCDEPVCIVGNDDYCGLQSQVSWCAQENALYYIFVFGFGGATGDFELDLYDDGVLCTDYIPCIPEGACCFPDIYGTCQIMTEADCIDAGGTYQGDDTDCGGVGSYTVDSCTNSFFDISGTGAVGPSGDDSGLQVPIGFTFNFYGNDYTDIAMSTNGYLTFGSDWTDYSNDCPIPDDWDPNDLIAPYWDDYYVDLSPGTIYYETFGLAPARQFIVQWDQIRQLGDSDSNTFQAVLYEGTNTIEYRYGLITPEGYVCDVTVGIENIDGTVGIDVPAASVVQGDCLAFNAADIPNPCPRVVPLDIKPGSCPNAFNATSQGVLPIAVLGTDEFDATTIDGATVSIARADGVGGSVSVRIKPNGMGQYSIEDVGTPYDGDLCGCHAISGDGYMDFTAKFKTPDLVAALELDTVPVGTDLVLTVSGMTDDGRSFYAMDCIRFVGNPHIGFTLGQ